MATFELSNGQVEVYKGTKNYLLGVNKEFEDEVTLHVTLKQIETLAAGLQAFVNVERSK